MDFLNNLIAKMHPRVIATNFLSEHEIADIKQKVLMLREHWQYLSVPQGKSVEVQMLPRGLYCSKLHDYQRNVFKNNELMDLHFSEYYYKIRQLISDYLNIDLDYSHTMQRPGFHVFELPQGSSSGEYNSYNYHTDLFQYELKLGAIQSFLVPIEIPENPGLSYKLDDNNTYTVEYDLGSVITWHGSIMHSIHPFTLKPNQRRITMQMHVSIGQKTIFW